ncbi:unnamed protein product, partial [marine sediment metagenome]
DLTCPECQKPIQVPFEVKEPPTLDDITNTLNEALKGHLTADQVQNVIREQLGGLKPPTADHRHKTGDEFFDCPECFSWVEKTAQRYQVTKKEPEKEPEPTEQPVGSIFGAKTGD